jgi:hypothetical protein
MPSGGPRKNKFKQQLPQIFIRPPKRKYENLSLQQSFTLPRELLHTSMFLQKMWDMVDHTVNVWCYVSFTISLQLSTKGCEKSYPSPL